MGLVFGTRPSGSRTHRPNGSRLAPAQRAVGSTRFQGLIWAAKAQGFQVNLEGRGLVRVQQDNQWMWITPSRSSEKATDYVD